jgi:hypothetical protein
MAKFNLDNYELVEDRLKKFWKDNPEGRINTDVVSSSDDGTMVIVKAELFINKNDDTPVSSGLAQETKGLGGFANNEAWLENCESSAIGRALANWKYQGNKKPRPTQEEMKKVVEDTPKKKEVAQETGTPHSKPRITEAKLKEIVLTSCKDNVDFAKKCYKDCMNRTIIKTRQDDIALWEDETITKFLDLVEIYITKHEDSFKDRESNSKLINDGLDVGLELEEIEDKVEEKEMDFDNDDWKAGKEEDPMTDAQEGFLKSLITQAIDSGLDELGAQAKQYLNSGNTSKVTCSDWINKLKNAIDKANG